MTEDDFDWSAMVVSRRDLLPFPWPELGDPEIPTNSSQVADPLTPSLTVSLSVVVADYREESVCSSGLIAHRTSTLSTGLAGGSILLSLMASYFIWRHRAPMKTRTSHRPSPSELARLAMGLGDQFQVCIQSSHSMQRYFNQSRRILHRVELIFDLLPPHEQELLLQSHQSLIEVISSYSAYWHQNSRCSRLTPYERLIQLETYSDALDFLDQTEDSLCKLRQRELELLRARISQRLADSISRRDLEQVLTLSAECEALEIQNTALYRQSLELIDEESCKLVCGESEDDRVQVSFRSLESLPTDHSALMLVSHMLHLLDLKERRHTAERDQIDRRRSFEEARRMARETAMTRMTQMRLMAGLREGTRSSRRVVSLLQMDRLRLERQALEKEHTLRTQYLRLIHVIVGVSFATAHILQRIYLKTATLSFSNIASFICSLRPSNSPIAIAISAIGERRWFSVALNSVEMVRRSLPFQRYLNFQNLMDLPILHSLYCGMNVLQLLVIGSMSKFVLQLLGVSSLLSSTLIVILASLMSWQQTTAADVIFCAVFTVQLITWVYIYSKTEYFTRSRGLWEIFSCYYIYPLALVLLLYFYPNLDTLLSDLFSSWKNSYFSLAETLNAMATFLDMFFLP